MVTYRPAPPWRRIPNEPARWKKKMSDEIGECLHMRYVSLEMLHDRGIYPVYQVFDCTQCGENIKHLNLGKPKYDPQEPKWYKRMKYLNGTLAIVVIVAMTIIAMSIVSCSRSANRPLVNKVLNI